MNREDTEIWGIRPACPQPYTIQAPPGIPKTARFRNIENWRWFSLREVFSFAARAHIEATHKLGKPTAPIPWHTENDGGLSLVRDFGLLMDGNTADLGKPHVYTYVIFPSITRIGEFRLQYQHLPEIEAYRNGWVYVPSGWANEVLRQIALGIIRAELGDCQIRYRRYTGDVVYLGD